MYADRLMKKNITDQADRINDIDKHSEVADS